MNIPTKIITHHAVSSKTHTAQDVDDWHKLRWSGFTSSIFKNKKGEFYTVGYHYVIEWDGTVVQTRDASEEGAHCIGMNTSSIGVCFMGNFDMHMPSKAQEESFVKLYNSLSNTFKNILPSDCVPHRKYAQKSCHGALLSDDYFVKLILKDVPFLERRVLELRKILASLKSKK